MKELFIDLETYSDVDLSKSGVYRYAQSSNFEILLFAYSVDKGPVQVINIKENEQIPTDVLNALTDNSVKKYAYNAVFERICLSKYLGYPIGMYLSPNSWYCDMVHSATLGLPLSLENVGIVLGIEKQKLSIGKSLIKYFCIPCTPTKANGYRTRNLPHHDRDKWNEFIKYNKRDVETEMEIHNRLAKFPVLEQEWDNYHLDQRINDYGIMIDIDFVNHAIRCDEENQENNIEKVKLITGVNNPNSPKQLKEWLIEQGMTEIDSLSKADVTRLLKDATGNVEEILKLRQDIAKSSVKKYIAMQNVVCKDDRCRGLIQFYGANRTGRYAGRLIQMQNLPQNHLELLSEARELIRMENLDGTLAKFGAISTVLSELIRTAFIPKKGYRFIVSDFSAIEARVLAWLSKEEWRLELFRNGGDIYCMSASKMFGVPVEKNGINKELRQKGKIAELACIAEDELVLTNNGLIPIQYVTTKDRVWDGENFVSHDGVIFKGYREVIEYAGLRATKDHKVYVEGREYPIRFDEAFKSRLHIIKTGNGWNTVRMGRNYFPNKTMDKKSPLCYNKMQRMSNCKVDKPSCSSKWKKPWMSALYKAKTNTRMAIQKVKFCKSKMRKPKGFWIQELWCKRNKICIQLSNGSRVILDKAIWDSTKKYGNRQNQQQQRLWNRKSSICNAQEKQLKQKVYYFDRIPTNILALCLFGSNKEIISRNDKKRDNRGCKKSSKRKKKVLEINRSKVRVYDILNAGPYHRYTVSNCLVHNCGYGGSVGALKAFGAVALGIKESELKGIIDKWREANPNIIKLWWEVDKTAKNVITNKSTLMCYGLKFSYEKGIMFIELPSKRRLAYCKPRIGINALGLKCITYEGIGTGKKWERIESYGPKLVENIVQGIARDILAEAMMRLYKNGYKITMHIHDEVVLEVEENVSTVEEVCRIMKISPTWAKDLPLNADGYECKFYKKE